MEQLEQIQQLANEAKELFEAGDITKEEFAEILNDIKSAQDVENMSDNVVLKGQILTALDIATYVV